MMYNRKFAVALKSAGQVLREVNGEQVYLPFGAEYSVFCKNMHNRRAIASIKIDGKDIGDGLTFVVPAHGQLEIERFVKNGNLEEGNRFKFIERTAKVAAHRGTDIADGLVEVTFQLEREKPKFPIRPTIRRGRRSTDYYGGNDMQFTSKGIGGGDLERSFSSQPVHDAFASTDLDGLLGTSKGISTPVANETGVTAPGAHSDQQFTMSEHFDVEAEKITFVLQILGETADNRHIREPVTVRTRTVCSQCGTRSIPGTKFCPECGASLQIV